MNLRYFLFLLISFASSAIYAQCDSAYSHVYFVLHTDSWPAENYWQLSDSGAVCSDSTFLIQGANLNVGCGGQTANNSPEGYDGNATIYTDTLCLPDSAYFTLHSIDTYGDGGLVIEVYENGALTHVYYTQGSGNDWTFRIGESNAPVEDSPCSAALVVPDGPVVSLDNTNAMAQFGEPAPPGGLCSTPGYWCEGAATQTVWATFQPQPNASYEITTCNSGNAVDTQIALWKVTDCADFSTYVLVNSNDDKPGGCSGAELYSSQIFVSCLDTNFIYLLQIDGYYGAVGPIELSIATAAPNNTVNAQVSNINCPVDKGQAATGGISAYFEGSGVDFTCSWIGPGGFVANTPIIANIAPGTYSIEAVNSCGVQANASFTVTEPDPWSIVVEPISPSCEVASDGGFQTQISGGTEPYTIAWNSIAYQTNNPSPNDLGAGTYTLTVQDANDCTVSQDYTLLVTNVFGFNLGEPVTLCKNFNDSILIQGPLDCTYEWSNGTNAQNLSIVSTNMEPGAYQAILTATSAQGCVASDVFSYAVEICTGIEEPLSSRISIFPQPAIDQLTVKNDGGVEIERIRMYDAAGRTILQINNTSQRNVMISPLPDAGWYILEIAGQHGEIMHRNILILK